MHSDQAGRCERGIATLIIVLSPSVHRTHRVAVPFYQRVQQPMRSIWAAPDKRHFFAAVLWRWNVFYQV